MPPSAFTAIRTPPVQLAIFTTNDPLADVAASFNVQVGQLKAWAKQAVEEGYVEKRTRPVRYVLNTGD